MNRVFNPSKINGTSRAVQGCNSAASLRIRERPTREKTAKNREEKGLKS